MSASLDMALNKINEFFDTYPALDGQITCRLCNTLEEIYGNQLENEVFGKIKASYHPARGEIIIPLANIRDNDDLERSLRHEAIGHFGINTFIADEKRRILSTIIDARDQPGINKIWDLVEENYPDLPLLMKAEEVFAYSCEAINPAKSIDQNQGNRVLRETCTEKTRPMQLQDLIAITELVADGLRDRSRTQQIFPATDHDQFRIETKSPIFELGGQRYAVIHADDLVQQNRRSIMGKVMAVEPDAVYTKFGKDAEGRDQVVAHHPAKLDIIPALGSFASINYGADGLGKLATKERGHGLDQQIER
ncbi:MAG: hypothetical protein PHT38_04120 [Halothiobacillus sp.]|nr:hypothetical protein [Halothiobacillus sp.]